jgi:hypothetical protein
MTDDQTSNEHLESLERARERVIELRRLTIESMAQGKGNLRKKAARLVTLQEALTAIDDVIEHERNLARESAPENARFRRKIQPLGGTRFEIKRPPG